MLNDARPNQFSKIYIRPGKTDCRMEISGLSNLIRFELRLNPFQKNVLFLFSGNSRKMIKVLIWEGLSADFFIRTFSCFLPFLLVFSKKMCG